ncbi:MAG: hypothetical protein JJ920_19540 [Roseitalea sp.]|jgi:hypothetical protein|nr:hypothetical protein [Roseitalea sp.]MBO6722601.1 hypothetical protein [Roseitalea sp.]MBO6745110.1 hypothetical protein [Roseitalea sp.]
MHDDNQWYAPIEPKQSATLDWGNNLLRATLLFGVLAVAVGMFAAPYLQNSSARLAADRSQPGIDFMTTASTRQQRSTYTMRRSVLQNSPNAVCIIHANGIRSGDCSR